MNPAQARPFSGRLGLETLGYFTSREILALSNLPKSYVLLELLRTVGNSPAETMHDNKLWAHLEPVHSLSQEVNGKINFCQSILGQICIVVFDDVG